VHDLNHEGTEDDEGKEEAEVPASFPNFSSTDQTPMKPRRTLRDAAGKVRIVQGWKKVLNTRQTLPAAGPPLHLGRIKKGDSEKSMTAFTAKTPFVATKVLQRAAHRAAITRTFNSKLLATVKTDALGHTGAKSSAVTVLHSLLSSDQSTKDLVDLTFDPRKLSQVAASIIKAEKASSAEKAKQVKQDDERAKKAKARQRMSQLYQRNYLS
jgi:hypothetical protein